MQNLPFRLEDLEPKETIFTLAGVIDDQGNPRPLTLCRWSLRVRAWASAKFGGPEGLQAIFALKKIDQLTELAWFMLKDKSAFVERDGLTPYEVFLDSISSVKDQLDLVKALMGTVGMGEPEVQKLAEGPQGEAPSPNEESPKP